MESNTNQVQTYIFVYNVEVKCLLKCLRRFGMVMAGQARG